MGVDGHRDFDVGVADDFAHDVRRNAEVKQERNARVSEVIGIRCKRTTPS